MYDQFLLKLGRSNRLAPMMCLLIVTFVTSGYSQTPINQKTDNQKAQLDTSIQIKADAQKRVNRLSDQLKSPFCPGKTLLTCTSFEAYRLRQEMTAMILAGKTDKQILLALRESFDDQLENPPQPFYTLLVPFLPFVFGFFIIAWMFSRWLKGSQSLETKHTENTDIDGTHKDRLMDLIHDD